MKKIIVFLFVLVLPLLVQSQEDEKKIQIKFSGFISNDDVYNTRQILSARGEGQFLLAPKPVLLDAEGNDINGASNFNFIGINSRLRVKFSGPDAFGAKMSGMIEGDFFGINTTTKFNFRLRHAFLKLDWEKSQLLVGQYWHPTFVTDCFPGTVSFGAGVPFNPLSRIPQFKYVYKLGKVDVIGIAMARGHFLNKGDANSQKNAMIPELHMQAQYKFENFVAGAGIGYQVLKPKIVSSTNYITNQTVNSTTVFGYLKTKLQPITVKIYGMYGQNNDNLVMMGGYAKVDRVYTANELLKGIEDYTPYNTVTSWIDMHTNGKKVQGGIFAGYSQNLGADKDVEVSTYVGRWGNVKSMMRVAPRIVFMSGKSSIGAELEYSSVNYNIGNLSGATPEEISGYDSKGVVTGYEAADNLKFLLNFKYSF